VTVVVVVMVMVVMIMMRVMIAMMIMRGTTVTISSPESLLIRAVYPLGTGFLAGLAGCILEWQKVRLALTVLLSHIYSLIVLTLRLLSGAC
jgi:hypothetical protein